MSIEPEVRFGGRMAAGEVMLAQVSDKGKAVMKGLDLTLPELGRHKDKLSAEDYSWYELVLEARSLAESAKPEVQAGFGLSSAAKVADFAASNLGQAGPPVPTDDPERQAKKKRGGSARKPKRKKRAPSAQ